MSILKGLAARARSMFGRGSSEQRMEEEFHFHIEMESARLVSAGVAPDEARRRALVAFGGLDSHREAMRDGRGTRLLHDLAADVRYALRIMRRSPGFAIAAALTLGVGIAVNGVVFGFVNSILFRPIPASRPEQLVGVFNVDRRTGEAHVLGYEDYADFRDRSGAFAGLAGMMGLPLNLVASQGADAVTADLVWGEMVTENFFSVLAMRPALGRFFTEAEAPQGANALAVLSHEAWRKRFRADSTIVGRVVRINGTEFTITGVAPPGFNGMRLFGFWPELWVPAGMHRVLLPGSTMIFQGRGGGWVMAFGRMHDGWSRDRTNRAADLFAAQLEQAHPATNAHAGVVILPAAVGFDHPSFVKPRVLLLASALGVFASIVTLLIICANLANLQLARTAARAREFAIRLALGCARGRLVRQLIVESAMLALPGVFIAYVLVLGSPAFEAHLLPRLQFRVGLDTQLDSRVAAFTAIVALLATALFGLAPALGATKPDLARSLGNVVGQGLQIWRRRLTLRSTLVVTQIAMSVVLLVGGTLFVRSLAAARALDLGFDPANRLLLSVNVGLQGYTESRGRRFYDEVLARVRALPSVASASWVFPVPFDTYGRSIPLYVEGSTTNTRTQTFGAQASFVAEDFVSALGLRLHAGREFTASDSSGAPQVMVVSRSLATRLWPGRDPIGQRARRGGPSGPEVFVVGVVADAKFESLGEASMARAYIPLRQQYRDWETLIVHTRGAPAGSLPHVKDIIAGADPALPAFGVTTMEESVESGLATSRTAALVAGFFGTLALVIASVGLYAVVASSVNERTREIGVRLALGATPAGVMRLVMQSGARLGAWGLVIGLAGAIAVARVMRGLLYGLSPTDPFTLALVPAVLALVVIVATYLPARRAIRLDPVTSLRSE